MTTKWTIGERPSKFKGLEPIQVAVNDQGIEIGDIGGDPRVYSSRFEYRHGDIVIHFMAERPPKNWVDYDPEKKMPGANFALGPVCQVWIDKFLMRRPLSDDETAAIKETITEFLQQEYRRFRSAVPPLPETIIFRN
jgi:hypothetical protein